MYSLAYICKYECAKIKLHKQALPVKQPNFDAASVNLYHSIG